MALATRLIVELRVNKSFQSNLILIPRQIFDCLPLQALHFQSFYSSKNKIVYTLEIQNENNLKNTAFGFMLQEIFYIQAVRKLMG